MKSSQVQDVYCVWWSQKFKGVLAKYVLTTQILLKLIFVGIGRTEYDLWTQNLMGKIELLSFRLCKFRGHINSRLVQFYY